jgi:hypothetical protein
LNISHNLIIFHLFPDVLYSRLLRLSYLFSRLRCIDHELSLSLSIRLQQ